MFVSKVKVFMKAGDGGKGVISFRREKYVPLGGPDGGNGGNGGNIVLLGDRSINTLSYFRYHRHFVASNGTNGGGSNCYGKNGEDLIIKVPIGTDIMLLEKVPNTKQTLIGSINKENERLILLKGGKGGTGNGGMATSTNRAPKETIPPEICEEKEILLILTLKTDVGILGAPNAGKSSLINILSRANSIIGDYAFTTINPVLGQMYNSNISLMDLPGIIEDAHKGKGKGIEFLRHAEQCKMFLYVIDGKNTPLKDYEMIKNEILKYGKKLDIIPYVIVINKIDLLSEKEIDNLKNIFPDGIFISVKDLTGINNLKEIIFNEFGENFEKDYLEVITNQETEELKREIHINYYMEEDEIYWNEYKNFLKIIGEEILDYLDEKRGFSLTLTNTISMEKLNLEHRNINKDTNIISLELEDNNFFLGEIILSFNKIEEEFLMNQDNYKNFQEYLLYIYIHGILHLNGYDHILDEDYEIMKNKEDKIFAYIIEKIEL